MTKLVNSVIVGFTTFIVSLAVFSNDYGQDEPPGLTLNSMTAQWGTVDAAGSALEAEMTIANEAQEAAELQIIRYEALLSDVVIASGAWDEPVSVPGGGSAVLKVTFALPAEFPVLWWTSHAANGESSDLRVVGSAWFLVGADPLTLPFEWESEWTYSLSDALEEGITSCATDSQSLCVVRSTATWASATDDSVVLALGIDVFNPTGDRLTILDGQNRLILQGIELASGQGPYDIVVDPGSEVHVDVPLTFEPFQFQGWWPRHVSDCERSATVLDILWVIESEGPQGSGEEGSEISVFEHSFATDPFESRFVCGHA